MGWLFGRNTARDDEDESRTANVFSSPGLALMMDFLARRPESAILELGPPSTESLALLAKSSHDVHVADLFRAAPGQEAPRVPAKTERRGRPERALHEAFVFPKVEQLSLPTEPGRFDAIFLWDLLHYVAPHDRRALGRRLAELSKPGALVFAVASASTPIPLTPIHFKIEGRDRLRYVIDAEERAEPPRLGARDVEQALEGFSAHKVILLRNGFQEMVLERNGAVAR
jgi:hypothetical protein